MGWLPACLPASLDGCLPGCEATGAWSCGVTYCVVGVPASTVEWAVKGVGVVCELYEPRKTKLCTIMLGLAYKTVAASIPKDSLDCPMNLPGCMCRLACVDSHVSTCMYRLACVDLHVLTRMCRLACVDLHVLTRVCQFD